MSIVTNLDNIFKKGVIGNVRKAQEDSHDIKLKTPNGDVFVVCDGMGGHVGGAKASSLAVESIISYLSAEFYPNPIAALDGALQFANIQILGFAEANPEYKGMGTTACIVLMRDKDVWIAHAGDSRIYLFLGKEKQLHRITKDHSYVQTLVDAGQITDDEAEHHPNKNRILKALGIKPELQPSFNYQNLPIHPKNGDVFLICSDGLSGMIPDTTIERVLSQNISLNEKGEQLIALAMQGETVQPGGQDNCTLELIKVDSSPWKKRFFKSYNPQGRPQVNNSKNSSRKKLIIQLSAIAAVLVAAAICLTLLIFNNDNKKAQYDKELSELQQKKNVAQKELDSLNKIIPEQIKKLEQERKECEVDPTKTEDRAKIEASIKNIQAKDKEIKSLNERKKELEKKRSVNEKIVSNFEKDSIALAKKYLPQENPSNANPSGSKTVKPKKDDKQAAKVDESAVLDKKFADLKAEMKKNDAWKKEVCAKFDVKELKDLEEKYNKAKTNDERQKILDIIEQCKPQKQAKQNDDKKGVKI